MSSMLSEQNVIAQEKISKLTNFHFCLVTWEKCGEFVFCVSPKGKLNHIKAHANNLIISIMNINYFSILKSIR